MYQSWIKLLFMHWQVVPALLQPHLPMELKIDTYQGNAWVGITPFALRNLRPVFAPPLPWLSNFHEINLRTYVHYHGTPGIWFLSLDADRFLAVMGARLTYHLPYRQAHISMKEEKGSISYLSSRIDQPAAEFRAGWQPGTMIGEAPVDSLDFFLTERYCLYSSNGKKLFQARIYHQPWQLQQASLSYFSSTLFQAHGLAPLTRDPLLHFSESQHVAVWRVKEVGRLAAR